MCRAREWKGRKQFSKLKKVFQNSYYYHYYILQLQLITPGNGQEHYKTA